MESHFHLRGFLEVKGITTAPNHIIIHYRWKANQEIRFEQFESLEKNYDSFWRSYTLKTSEGEVELPYMPLDMMNFTVEWFYEKMNSEIKG